jgi:hypothetical protein
VAAAVAPAAAAAVANVTFVAAVVTKTDAMSGAGEGDNPGPTLGWQVLVEVGTVVATIALTTWLGTRARGLKDVSQEGQEKDAEKFKKIERRLDQINNRIEHRLEDLEDTMEDIDQKQLVGPVRRTGSTRDWQSAVRRNTPVAVPSCCAGCCSACETFGNTDLTSGQFPRKCGYCGLHRADYGHVLRDCTYEPSDTSLGDFEENYKGSHSSRPAAGTACAGAAGERSDWTEADHTDSRVIATSAR